VLPLLLFLEPFLSLHSTHAAYLLVGFNPCFLESLNGLLKFLSDADIFPRKLNDSTESIFSFYPQLAQLVIQVIELWVIGDVSIRNFNFVLLAFVLYRYEPAVLPFFLHVLENFNQVPQLLLQLVCGIPD